MKRDGDDNAICNIAMHCIRQRATLNDNYSCLTGSGYCLFAPQWAMIWAEPPLMPLQTNLPIELCAHVAKTNTNTNTNMYKYKYKYKYNTNTNAATNYSTHGAAWCCVHMWSGCYCPLLHSCVHCTCTHLYIECTTRMYQPSECRECR